MKLDKQIHKRLTTEQVVSILDKQINKEITGKEAAVYLGISRRRLYQLRAEYLAKGQAFTIEYERKQATRRLDPAIEKNLRAELVQEKALIKNRPKNTVFIPKMGVIYPQKGTGLKVFGFS